MERNQTQTKYTWQTEVLFENMEAWENAFQTIEQEYGNYNFAAFSGKLADKQTLLQC